MNLFIEDCAPLLLKMRLTKVKLQADKPKQWTTNAKKKKGILQSRVVIFCGLVTNALYLGFWCLVKINITVLIPGALEIIFIS